MGMETKTVGGGGATSLSNDLLSFLGNGLQNGFGSGFGARPQSHGSYLDKRFPNFPGGQNTAGTAVNQFAGFGNILDKYLKGDLGDYGKALTSQFDNRKQDDINSIRAQYTMGGTGMGTPAAAAEAQYLSQATPNFLSQLGGLQQQGEQWAGNSLFQLMSQIIGIGTPQAQTVQTPSLGANLLSGATGVLGAIPGLSNMFGGGGIPNGSAPPASINTPYIPPALPVSMPNWQNYYH